jgi:hypothetical protein
MREPNAIDFWRGFALVTIFVNHIPGLWWEFATHRNFSLSDSAELFVFLAGWSLRRIAEERGARPPLGGLLIRLTGRAITIYAAQVFLTTLAIALIAAASILLDNPLLLEWNNAAAVFSDPVPAHVGLMMLTHQLGYFDILPLYVVLMLAAPLLVLIDRISPALLIVASIGCYLFVLTTGFNLPTWPVDGVWYFNPLAWQLIFVLGFLFARESQPGQPFAEVLPKLVWVAWPIVILAAVAQRTGNLPDPMGVPEPTLFYVVDKTYLTPLRLGQFLMLTVAIAPLFLPINRYAPGLVEFFASMGRNSMNVFCVGSLLSLSGQIARFIFGSAFVSDTVIVIVGIGALRFTAWVSEWRSRARSGEKSGR